MNETRFSLGKIVGLAVLGVVILFLLWGMSAYNGLVNLDEDSKTAQSDVEVQYQRRFELLPNIVKTVQGVAQLEKDVLDNIASARTRYSGAPSGTDEQVAAMNQFDAAFSRLLLIVENYPQLKSAENFTTLQVQLEGIENRIAVARNVYNGTVNELNKRIRTFPTKLVASLFGFGERARFEAVASAQQAPKVEFEFK